MWVRITMTLRSVRWRRIIPGWSKSFHSMIRWHPPVFDISTKWRRNDSRRTSGRVFYGENGTVHIDRAHLESDSEEIVKTLLGEDDVYLPRSPGHHRNWLDCIKSRKAPIADVEEEPRTVSMIHLGNLAY